MYKDLVWYSSRRGKIRAQYDPMDTWTAQLLLSES